MNPSQLTSTLLSEHPELAALRNLKTSLEVAELALVAIYPEIGERSDSERPRSEPEVCACAILYQIDALAAMLNEYLESLRRLELCRDRESSGEDIPF